MKQIKLLAAVFGMLLAFSVGAHAQTQSKAAEQTQKMNEAFERLKDSMSKGGTEGVSCAGDGVFSSLGDLGQGSGQDNAVRAPMSKSPRKSGLIKAAGADCWEVCVSWGPLHVCYTWETRCR
ncbi:MAG: hypothetical protein Q7J64_00730 [Elusimicrobiota bacterium]|nr:hypothetical protein [Elusimicrobiota bacterium]